MGAYIHNKNDNVPVQKWHTIQKKKKRANELNDTLHTEKRINVYKCAWPH